MPFLIHGSAIRSIPVKLPFVLPILPICWIVWKHHISLLRRPNMPATSYDYAIVRVVPGVERGECLNVGVILICRERGFLAARTHFDPQRLLALAPKLDLDFLKQHIDVIPLICAGGKQAGPIGLLSQPERFHWLVSPRSTIIQCSPVHSGICTDPQAALQHLFETMVLL